jgi:selenoprotein W-related protein
LANNLLVTYKQKIQSLTLVPASGGCFELSLNGKLIYSKLETGQFPDEQQIVKLLGGKL